LIHNIFTKVEQIQKLKSDLSRISVSQSISDRFLELKESKIFDQSKEFLLKFMGKNSGLKEFLEVIGKGRDDVDVNEVLKAFLE